MQAELAAAKIEPGKWWEPFPGVRFRVAEHLHDCDKLECERRQRPRTIDAAARKRNNTERANDSMK